MIRRRLGALIGAPLGLLLALTGCAGNSAPAAAPTHSPGSAVPTVSPRPSAAANAMARFYGQQLDWHDCRDSLQCATLLVPLDYSHPNGATLQLALLRIPASGKRIGSLVVNPGGPGASGVDLVGSYGTYVIPKAVRERFDVVGFDPRGVGESDPVNCLSDAELDQYVALDSTPQTAAQRQAVVNTSRHFAQACERKAGRLLPHLTTPDAARDMDVLRAAVGDRKLTYLGWSYGTYLGAWYAQLFPHRVRALILDGAVDPSLTGRELDKAQAVGFEQAFSAFLRSCVEKGCPLGSTVSAAERGYRSLIAQIAAHPIPAHAPGDDRDLNESLAVLGTLSALYSKNAWPYLRSGFSDAQHGDGSTLLALADQLEERDRNGHYSNLIDANSAINCVDHPEPRSPARYFSDVRSFEAVAPHFGAVTALGSMTCAFWPVPVTTPQGPLHAPGAAPILVIGTTRDPATPYQWAVNMAHQLDSGVLLTHNGDGHTVYGQGNDCVDRIGNAYLIQLKVPRPHTVC